MSAPTSAEHSTWYYYIGRVLSKLEERVVNINALLEERQEIAVLKEAVRLEGGY